jgi:hypothetical protein
VTYGGGLGLGHSEIIGFINVTETDDVLRLHELAGMRGRTPYEINDAGGYNAHLDAVLSGRDDRCREALARMLGRAVHSIVDLASARLLLHAGIDPATACALALMVDGPVTIDRDWDLPVVVNAPEEACDPGCTVAMTFAGDVSWNSEHGLRIGGLPDALAAAAVGHPLSDYVDHPAFTGLSLTLGETHERYDHRWIRVSAAEVVGIPALLGMRPSHGR